MIETPKALKETLGGDLVTIEAPDLKIEKIRELKFVTDIKQENNQTTLTIENVTKNLQSLLKSVGKINSVEVRQTTLNDVFLRFTGKTIQEEGKNTFFEKIIQASASRR